MRVRALGLCGIVAVGLGGVVGYAQGMGPLAPAPTTEARFWTLEELNGDVTALLANKGTSEKQLLNADTFQSDVRNMVGKQPVMVHAKRADFMMIRDGGGTFTTGGEIVEAKTNPRSGETSGVSIRGGTSRVLKPGDALYIPPGVPHHFSDIPDHVTVLLVRWDLK